MAERKKIKQYLTHIALIGAFSFLAMAASFYYGVTSGNDLSQHYQFADTIYRSMVSGEFYPSRADTPNQGYGDVGLRFYPPFSYYILSTARLVSGNWYHASLLTFFLLFWIGGTGIYYWAKEEFSAHQSLIAAGLYIFAPYHVNQIYNNFLYAEFAAAAILPFCFLFVTRVCRRGKLADVLGLSISFALLILTHLPLTIIGSIALSIYAVSLLRKNSALRVLPKLGVSVAAAAAASSFYWVRMITELGWINHAGETYSLDTFDYRRNFLLAPQNILNFQTDTSVLWFADLMLVAMLLISIPSAILFFRNRRAQSGFALSSALLFGVSILMTTPLTKFIWDNLSFLQKVQFPWRWLGIVSMSGAIFASSGLFRASETMPANKSYPRLIGLGLILTFYVFMAAFVIKQAVYLPRENFRAQILNIESANSFECWWSIWTKPEALQIKDKLVVQNRETEITNWTATEKTFTVSAGQAAPVRVAAFYYPRWQAAVNGKPVRVEISNDSSILIPLPETAAQVTLSFKESDAVRASNVISIFSWLLLAALPIFIFFYNRRPIKALQEQPPNN